MQSTENLKPLVFMFSGQGSQFQGMGKQLYDQNTGFKKHLDELDKTANQVIGRSIVELIYSNSADARSEFEQTRFSHPAIFMVEYALACTLIDMGIQPQFVLGASLGEYTAAAVANVIDPNQALETVYRQALIIESNCQQGGMLAVLEKPSLFEDDPILNQNSELAAVNFDSHFVISGRSQQLEKIESHLKEQDIICQTLSVTQGYHSSLMDAAAEPFLDYLNLHELKKPTIPFISCVTAGVLEMLDKKHLFDVVRNPIAFRKTIQKLESNGDYVYLDLGPSGTLSTFLKYNLSPSSNSKHYATLNPYGLDLKNLNKFQSAYQSEAKQANHKKTFLFPGQGSQRKGMGAELFNKFGYLLKKADDILGYSLEDLCLENPEGKLNQTQFTQPALYTVNAFTYFEQIEEGDKPDFVAGHSLGEYNALLAAGVFDFETGLRLVQKRGELMSQASGGGMAAVLGVDKAYILKTLKKNNLNKIDLANINAPDQIVLSGLKTDIEKAGEVFNELEVRFIPLNVSAAFHSRYMFDARNQFQIFLDSFEFKPPQIPVISNVTGEPYLDSEIKNNLINQIDQSVRWTDSMTYLLNLEKGDMEFKEVGPGEVLTGLVRKIRSHFDQHPQITNSLNSLPSQSLITPIASRSETAEESRLANTNKQTRLSTAAIKPESLGDKSFKQTYGIKYAYVAGGMYRGIASEELVIRMAKAGLLGFFGTGGLALSRIEKAILKIQSKISDREAYGMNLLNNISDPGLEEKTVDLFLKYDVQNIEAAAFLRISPALVKYRLKGLHRSADGMIVPKGRILAKISRPEVARHFLSPADPSIVQNLLQTGKITTQEAELAALIPMADDICVEADSGGHTDGGSLSTLLPVMLKLRTECKQELGYSHNVRVGAAGGIGTPEAAAAAFMLGADFILTGSINQCCVESGNSDIAKDLLQAMNVQDTDYAPAGDMFEIVGAKVQVLKKGVFFPARANKLYELYRMHRSLDEIDANTKERIQNTYFHRTFDQVYQDVKDFYPPFEIEKAERNPKHKMALVFRWYFGRSTRLAMEGNPDHQVDYQIHTGPALGAFNQWVKNTKLEKWQNRHVDEIAEKLMTETADFINQKMQMFLGVN